MERLKRIDPADIIQKRFQLGCWRVSLDSINEGKTVLSDPAEIEEARQDCSTQVERLTKIIDQQLKTFWGGDVENVNKELRKPSLNLCDLRPLSDYP